MGFKDHVKGSNGFVKIQIRACWYVLFALLNNSKTKAIANWASRDFPCILDVREGRPLSTIKVERRLRVAVSKPM